MTRNADGSNDNYLIRLQESLHGQVDDEQITDHELRYHFTISNGDMHTQPVTSSELWTRAAHLHVSTASYCCTSRGANFARNVPFLPAGMVPQAGSIVNGKMSAPPSLTTLPASYARARAVAGLPKEELGRGGIWTILTWAGPEGSSASLGSAVGRADCWLFVERPAEDGGRSPCAPIASAVGPGSTAAGLASWNDHL